MDAPVTPAFGQQTDTIYDPASEHDEIARLAYSLWEARGGLGGSPEDDWLRAEQEYRLRQLK